MNNSKNTLNRFLFKNITLIILSTFLLYKSLSFFSDNFANIYFSSFAKSYSAEHIFKDDYSKKEKPFNKIDKVGGFVLVLDKDNNVIFSSKENTIKKLSLNDISLLINGKYKMDNINYYASIEKIPNKIDEYGFVVLPSDIVKNITTITTPNRNDTKSVIYYLLIKSLFLILVIVLLIFVFSKILKRKLVTPLQNLKLGFSKLKKEDYSITFEQEDIQEFNELNNAFKELSNNLEILNNNKNNYKRKRNQLFSDISHDLKTPITVIKGYSEAILQKKVNPHEIDNYIGLIKKNADNLEKLTRELSSIVNYERSDYELNLENVDIIEFFRQAIIDFLPIFEEKNINIINNIPNEKFYYPIDVKLFFRVLQNLMSNIIHHNPDGINVLFEMKIIDNEKIEIIIADTGIPIKDTFVNDIFDAFKTYDTSRNSSQNNGLGLAIVKRIISLHKGEIYLDTKYPCYSKAFILNLFL